MISTVVFDLGGVLIDWNPKYLYRKLLPDEESIDDFLNNVCTFEWNEQQDGGQTIEEAVGQLLPLHPEKEALIRAYYDRFLEMLGGPIDETVAVLDDLRQSGTRILALTNWSAETFPHAVEKFDFLAWFDGIIVSGAEKVMKPDPAIFQRLVERYQVDATEAVFIDDRQINVDAAISSGFGGVLFQSGSQLRADLRGMGLLGAIEGA